MKKTLLVYIGVGILAGITIIFFYFSKRYEIVSPLGKNGLKILEKPLEKYTFEKLREKKFEGSFISIGKKLNDLPQVESYQFSFSVFDESVKKEKKVSGLLNIPKTEGTYPIIVMFRGFVPQEIYSIGEGTRHSGEVFARK